MRCNHRGCKKPAWKDSIFCEDHQPKIAPSEMFAHGRKKPDPVRVIPRWSYLKQRGSSDPASQYGCDLAKYTKSTRQDREKIATSILDELYKFNPGYDIRLEQSKDDPNVFIATFSQPAWNTLTVKVRD